MHVQCQDQGVGVVWGIGRCGEDLCYCLRTSRHLNPPNRPTTQKRSVGAVMTMVYCPRLSRFMQSFYLASGLLLPLILSSQGSGVVIIEDERRDLQSSTSSSFFDCVDPRNPSLTSIVRKGDPTTVCLFVGPDGDWNDNISYKRFSLTLTADEFTSYEIPGCE